MIYWLVVFVFSASEVYHGFGGLDHANTHVGKNTENGGTN